MAKLTLIREVDVKGGVFYWSELDGVRVTEYRTELSEARKLYDQFVPVEPTKDIIEEKEV